MSPKFGILGQRIHYRRQRIKERLLLFIGNPAKNPAHAGFGGAVNPLCQVCTFGSDTDFNLPAISFGALASNQT